MRSVLLDYLSVQLTLGALSGNASDLEIEKTSIDCDSRASALEKYEETLDSITEMLKAYEELLSHDVAQIKDSAAQFMLEDQLLSNIWKK